MSWVVPEFSREMVNVAGRILIEPEGHSAAEQEHALIVIGNWRLSHSFPLNCSRSAKFCSAKSSRSNTLKVELQIRSQPQHIWATAVETVGTFVKQALKSSQGEEDWLRFFALMGTAIATRERTAPVPDTPTDKQSLKKELREYAQRLDVLNHLSIYAAACDAPQLIAEKDAHYFLLELDTGSRSLKVTGYKSNDLARASNDYMVAERSAIAGSLGRDAVLVSVDSFKALKRAYPNYFLDTHRFIKDVSHAIQ